MRDDLTREDIRTALEGEPEAIGRLVEYLTPLIQVRVGRALLRCVHGLAAARARQETEDLVQEVLISLFTEEGRVLRNWDPARGLSLRNYVGLVAERRVVSLLRSSKRSFREEPSPVEELDHGVQDSTERRAASRDRLRLILRRLRADLSPQGWQMFRLLFMLDKSVDEVARETGLSSAAIYAWRSRLRRAARRLNAAIESDSAS